MGVVGPLAESDFALPILGEVNGWRISFVVVSCVAIVASLFSFFQMPDVPPPPMTQEEKQQAIPAVIASEIGSMLRFLRYPSFDLMILQGIFGTIPWLVLGNLNLYVRLCGFEQWTLFWLGFPGIFGLLGGLLGGVVSDSLVKKFGPRGRPMTALATISMGIPLQFLIWYGIPPGSYFNNVWVFMFIQTLFQLLGGWCQPGCNFPVLGQIVTGKDRNKVMCWEMAFENTCATIIGSNAVPYVIKWLGSDDIDFNGETDLVQARALGTAQTLIIVIPWAISFLVYANLLWAFPLDLKRVEAELAAGADNTELVAGEVAL